MWHVASATGPYRGLSCDDNGDVVKIDLSSSSLQGYLPYMADFGLGLPKLTTLDLHDNSLTGPMVYSYGDAYNFGDGDSSAYVPRFNNVILDTDSVKRALLPDDFILNSLIGKLHIAMGIHQGFTRGYLD